MDYLKKLICKFYFRKGILDNIFTWGEGDEYCDYHDNDANITRLVVVGDFEVFDRFNFVKEYVNYDVFFVDIKKDIFNVCENSIIEYLDRCYNYVVTRNDNKKEKIYQSTIFMGYGLGCNIICSFIEKKKVNYEQLIFVSPRTSILTEYSNKYTGFTFLKNISKKINDFYLFDNLNYIDGKRCKVFLERGNSVSSELKKYGITNVEEIDMIYQNKEMNLFHTHILRYTKKLYIPNHEYVNSLYDSVSNEKMYVDMSWNTNTNTNTNTNMNKSTSMESIEEKHDQEYNNDDLD